MDNDPHVQHRPHQPDSPFFSRTTKKFASILGVFSVSHIAVFRSRPGYHTVRLSLIIPVVLLLLFWDTVLNLIVNHYIATAVSWLSMGFFRVPWVYFPDSPLLRWLALAMLVCGWVKRNGAWRALFEDRGWNTYSNGKSYLCYLLPWVRPDWINRVVEPLVCGFVGIRLYESDNTAAGIWMLLSAVSVWWTELRYLEWVLASQFARHNTLTLAVMQQELIGGIQSGMQRRAAWKRRLLSLPRHAKAACLAVLALACREPADASFSLRNCISFLHRQTGSVWSAVSVLAQHNLSDVRKLLLGRLKSRPSGDAG